MNAVKTNMSCSLYNLIRANCDTNDNATKSRPTLLLLLTEQLFDPFADNYSETLVLYSERKLAKTLFNYILCPTKCCYFVKSADF